MNEQETIDDIIEEMRFHVQLNIDAEKDKPEFGILIEEGRIAQNYADRLEAAHKREIDVLKQRCAELNAEVAAKDEVIKRLNDAISEEQRRKMATTENPSAVGNARRNCDMPLVVDGPADNNADKAWLAFKRHKPDAYFDVSGLLRCIDWLLAPATNKEGGAK